MAVFLFTFHAYRSWTEDNPRGYIQRGRSGIQPPSPGLAKHRARIAVDKPALLNDAHRQVLIDGARDMCQRRVWRLHAAAATPTHVHLLISWKEAVRPNEVSTVAKRLLGMMLSKDTGTKGNRWFSRGCDRTQVRDRRHFDHLVSDYLPAHANQNGVVWIENGAPHGNAVLMDPQKAGTAFPCGAST